MNITCQTMNTSFRPSVSTKSRPMPKTAKTKGDYDTVNISSSRTAQTDDESFARILARKTAAQLGSASQERVQELRAKVTDGSYVPDASRIAGRMLGLG